jgi:hypothetical protein
MISERVWKQLWLLLVVAMLFSGACYWSEQFELGATVGFFGFMACLAGMGKFLK